MNKSLCILPFLVLTTLSMNAQNKLATYEDVADSLKRINLKAMNSKDLVTGKGFNLFIQRKVANYLSGSSELSLYKTYATYSSENDMLTFGLNFDKKQKETGRLISLINPMIETNIKNNFATLYKKGEWQADIRAGLKYTYLLPFSTINYYPLGTKRDQKGKVSDQQTMMIIRRSKQVQEQVTQLEKDGKAYVSATDIFQDAKDKLKDKGADIATYEQEINKIDFAKKNE